MIDERVSRDFTGTKKPQIRQDFPKPKIHIVPQKPQIYPSNSLPTKTNGRRSEKKNFRYYLKYYSQRKMSVAMHLIALATMGVLVALETAEYRRQPTETTLEDDMYPVQNIEFPGVAICNINVISREAAMTYAETLWLNEEVRAIPNLTLEKVKHVLRYLGTLYQFEHKELYPGDLMLLHEILERGLSKNYKISRIMQRLAPSCQSFLLSCQWQGKYRHCDELFVSRWTPDGYCCTFNHVRWTDGFVGVKDANFEIPVERFEIAGMDYGLFVTLRPSLEDYYYTLLPAQGFKVLLYTAADYPDGPSGGLREILLRPGCETFVQIDASLFYSSPEILRYTKEERRCLFNTERTESYGGTYSYSQCIMLCRVFNIHQYCQCIPFFYPFPEVLRNAKKCDIRDLFCMEKYRYKWWSYQPPTNEFVDPSNIKARSFEEHLDCDCFPSCENTHFTVTTSHSSIYPQSVPLGGCANETMGPDDMVLHIAYSGIGTMRLKRDVMYHWYDLLSKYGGLCSLCLGVSVITPLEILYGLWIRLWQRRKKNIVAPVKRFDVASKPARKIHKRTIYWDELIPSKLAKSSSSSAASSIFHRQS